MHFNYISTKFLIFRPEQVLVYQAIERSGNKYDFFHFMVRFVSNKLYFILSGRGIWTRDIKIATNIPQHSLTKTLKILEQRLLIKSVRSVVSKSKKLYMIYDMVPAKEITGGPWYSDQEFDHEFVQELGNFIVQVVKTLGMADLATINDKVRISGISKVSFVFNTKLFQIDFDTVFVQIELSAEELELVVNTLVYDFRLEEVLLLCEY
jgi:DNA-directed RNA polymerase III subunit RPC6